MPGRSFKVGRIAGIPIGISPWWLAIVAFLSWSLGNGWFPELVPGISPSASYALGLLSALLLFASILLHELGHALVAQREGIAVEEIDLWLLGGVARLRDEAHEPDDELRYALAGPLVTAVVVAAFAVLDTLLGSRETVAGALVRYELVVNGLILVFNLVPAFPLDGGRVLRALLWRRSGDRAAATATAALAGRMFGGALVALGVLAIVAGYAGGIWLSAVGVFIIVAADAQAAGAAVDAALSGVPAAALMTTPAETVRESAPIEQTIVERLAGSSHKAFPVVSAEGVVVGMLTLTRVAQLPHPGHRPPRRVADVVDRDPGLLAQPDDDVALLLHRPAFARVGRLAIVNRDGAPLGVLSITDVQRTLRLPPNPSERVSAAERRAPTGYHA